MAKMRAGRLGILASCLVASGMVAGSPAWAKDATRLRARLLAVPLAGDVSGQAEFRIDDQGRRRFSTEIEGFRPGEIFDVMAAGVIVGTIVVDGTGQGDLNFDTNFEAGDDPATLFPANFPALDGGELVQVGPLSGTLQPKD